MHAPMMRRVLCAALVVVSTGWVAGCGGDDAPDATASPTEAPAPPTEAPTTPATDTPTTVPPSTESPTTLPPATEPPATPPPTLPTELPVPVIWPQSDVVLATPRAAARDFVESVFAAGPFVGRFHAGDATSGEIEVYAGDPTTGAPIGTLRSTLLLRRFGEGWYVTAAISDQVTIDQPAARASVPASMLTVSGEGTGFEASLGLRAFPAGDATDIGATTTMAGNMGEVLPYSADLDVSGTAPGTVVVILVHGGTGLETDPGHFSALPVVIAS